ncbi:MAG: 50S ribosomal protein L7/L12 [Myxococcota bacterium]|jgi:large subunit ribosomal protein L7/L12|nr:50S ribosomal protein L7/L12 [Myxococcota bacterium]OQC40977.1 MAG: 50S ribosomal protein L7 [Deltaproteobacteria bacterium ADurb.Bin058]HHW95784.1 50S ribosomal protein L7/L12 [Oligoflexales bacterium]MBP8971147.1 50S ribosomal protein L7/L12 [Myxococcota bacterium]HOE82211.1 50S ribosomal protein L7/L12 [Myxococcota bacterium]
MADITREQVKDYLSKLTVLEIAELTKELEELWGVTAAAPVAVAAAAPAAAAEVKEEQTEFDVILEGFEADKKVAVIKEMRTVLPALGLKEAKELVEGAPKTIKEAVSKAEAEDVKKKLEAVGGKVKIQ